MKTLLKTLAALVLLAFMLVGGYLWWVWNGLFAGIADYTWHQEIRLVIQTPDGEIVARSVQGVETRYYPNGIFATDRHVEHEMTGEAVVADLGHGRTLIGLMGEGRLAEKVYHDLGTRPVIYEALSGSSPPARRDIPSTHFSVFGLVTFGDVNDPTSAQMVARDDLAATFGPGYALKEVSFGITQDPPTMGELEQVLPWLDGDHPLIYIFEPSGARREIWHSRFVLKREK